MRLIDAGWLVDRLRWKTVDTNPDHFALHTLDGVRLWSTNNGINAGLTMAETEIANCKTIDAVPVRHGKWYNDEDAGGFVCSVCGGYTCEIIGDAIETDNGIVWVDSLPNYCHKCGARMDGDSE